MAHRDNVLGFPMDEIVARAEIGDMEIEITIYQLWLLSQIEADARDAGLCRPMMELNWERIASITVAPMLREETLRKLAQARALERLGLIVANHQESRWYLTERGRLALRHWRRSLGIELVGKGAD